MAMHNPLGLLCAVPMGVWLVVTVRRAQRMRDAALAALETGAPQMPRTEVERRLETILRVYGGKPFPSVRQRVARIRDQTVD
jgi:hypothetical protein